uniref:DGPFAETKE family protein n=1 Tax=Solibacter usitatus (strain Ellin6076) TaxID=234267 RepID=Q01VR6_SOLUE
MKYMLLVYGDEENSMTTAERDQCYVDSAQYCRELAQSGNYLGAAPLHFTSTATSVRVRDNRRIVTDGPFAETREQLGGYFLIEARDLDEAISIAARIPGARYGTIEVRPIMEIPGLPEEARS